MACTSRTTHSSWCSSSSPSTIFGRGCPSFPSTALRDKSLLNVLLLPQPISLLLFVDFVATESDWLITGYLVMRGHLKDRGELFHHLLQDAVTSNHQYIIHIDSHVCQSLLRLLVDHRPQMRFHRRDSTSPFCRHRSSKLTCEAVDL